ncbi:MAG: hypothetical protein V3V62_14335 [bacterium]
MANTAQDRLADTFRVLRASRYSAPEREGDALPIALGDLTLPARTDAGVYKLPKIDTAGAGTWCIAGHRIKGAVSLFDDNGAIPGGNFTVNVANNFQGKGVIATAAFSAAPTGKVSAVCQGLDDAGGALIENPFRVIESLMTGFWGFALGDIDPLALSRAVEGADALGYKAAGLLLNDHAPAAALTDILGDFLGRYEVDALGRLRLSLAAEEAATLHPVKALPAFPAENVSAETSRDSVINQAPVLYAKDHRGGDHILHDDGEAEKDAASQALYGVRLPSRGRLDLDWIRQEAVARKVQARIVERFAEPARFWTLRDSTLRALEVEQDDYVSFSVPWGRTEDLEPLTNQIGQVVSVGIDPGEQTMELRLRDTGRFLKDSSGNRLLTPAA